MRGDSYTQMRDELSRIPKVRRRPAIFLGQVGNLALVRVGDSEIRVPMIGYLPHPDTPVWLGSQDGKTVCEGSSYQFSPYGTILANPSDNMVRVEPDDGPELVLPYRAGLSLSSGNRVEINPTSRVVQGLLSTTPDAPPSGGGGSAPRPFSGMLIQAADSGTSNGGSWWQNNVNSDSTAGGAWFYGSRLFNALKGVKTVSRAEVYFPRLYSHVGAPTLRLHTSGSRPGSGLPSFMQAHGIGAASGWVRVPPIWALHMRDNSGHGIGFLPTVGVFASWRGTAADRLSGAWRISGTR